MEKAAGQGHAYAMQYQGNMYCVRKEYEQAVKWFTKGAEAGLPGTPRGMPRQGRGHGGAGLPGGGGLVPPSG